MGILQFFYVFMLFIKNMIIIINYNIV